MEKPLNYDLTNPAYTIYHRAALGGLAATIRAWGRNMPPGISADLIGNKVVLSWADDISHQEAVRRILTASFRLTADHLIDLPGQAIGHGAEDLRLAVHSALTMTFLQHNKMRPAPPGKDATQSFVLRSVDDDTSDVLSYKAVGRYAHQTAQKSGLLKEPSKRGKNDVEALPDVAAIPQWCIPGALSGARDLQASAENVMLLTFLMVACPVFLLRSRRRAEKAQYCVVVPDVRDLQQFARVLQRLAARGDDFHRFSNTYLGRVVGGSEEAALRFLVELEAEDVADQRSVNGCLAITMGKVPWDKNQINRSSVVRIGGEYSELGVFRAANTHLGGSRLIKTKDNNAFAIPRSPVPELIAANLASGRHWCAHFKMLVSERSDADSMLFLRKGLMAMKQAIRDTDDQAIVRVVQDAWHRTMGAIGDRARREGLAFERLVEVERERMRNAILRTKTADTLASWLLRFCADATKGASLGAIRDDANRIRTFIFNPRNFDRFQNLCLFALLSYVGEPDPNTVKKGDAN